MTIQNVTHCGLNGKALGTRRIVTLPVQKLSRRNLVFALHLNLLCLKTRNTFSLDAGVQTTIRDRETGTEALSL